MRAGLRIGEQGGDVTVLVRCLTFLPFIYRLRGQVEMVRSVITRALTVSEARDISIITGHRAWVAWRDGDMVEAEAYGRATLEDRRRQQRVNAFLWLDLWPLIGVVLPQEKMAEPMSYDRILFNPTQQPHPATPVALPAA